MQKMMPVINNFIAGEVSPRVEGRFDLPQYNQSCRILENFIIATQGGADRRPGTPFVGNGKNDADKIRFIPFVLASGNYVLEFGYQYIRFYKDHVRIEGETGPIEVETTYTLAELFELKYVQTNDSLYIFHPNHDPKELTQGAAGTPSSTTEGDAPWQGPIDTDRIYDNDDNTYGYCYIHSVYMDEKETWVNWVVTFASAQYLDQVTFIYKHTFQGIDDPYSYHEAEYWLQVYDGAWQTLYHRSPFRTDESKTTKILTVNLPNVSQIRLRTRLKTYDIWGYWQYARSFCYEIKYGVSSWTFGNIVFTGTDAPDFSKETGTPPGCVALFEQRMVLAGAIALPNRIWLSKPGDLTDFNSTDGLIFDVYHTKRMLIKWLAAKDVIVFGAENVEGVITGNGAPLTNINYQIRIESPNGSGDVQGEIVNEKVLFVQKGNRRLREFGYLQDIGGWFAPDLTILADHIAGPGITQMSLQTNPDTVLWCVRGDGQLIGITYEKPYGIAGWHRHNTDGEVESVAVIPGYPEDEIWISVKRSVNGVTKRFIEYFKPRNFGEDQSDCFFVDCGKTFDGGGKKDISGATQAKPVVITCTDHDFENDQIVKIRDVEGMTELNTTNDGYYMVKNKTDHTFELYHTNGTDPIDGTEFSAYTGNGTAQRVIKEMTCLDHLEGKTVAVLIDGAAHPDGIVSGGKISLQYYSNKVHSGLPYISKLKPQSPGPPVLIKRINEIKLRLYKSLGCKIGPDEDHLDTIIFRRADDLMDHPPELFTGDQSITFPGDYDENANILIVQDQPLPFNLLAIIPKMGVHG